MRSFSHPSALYEGSLALSLAPALTLNGIEPSPLFFEGQVVMPQLFSRCLVVLSDIVATRYYKFVPSPTRDPILTAQGDRLRAECFSACNGVYARLDVLSAGLDGDLSYGTTNVDIGSALRQSLLSVQKEDKLRLAIGDDGLTARRIEMQEAAVLHTPIVERSVEMPHRWVKALGNVAGLHREMEFAFSVKGIFAKQFLSTLPSAVGKEQSGYVTYQRNAVQVQARPRPDSVYLAGLHRLGALKRILTEAESIAFYRPKGDVKSGTLVEVTLPHMKFTLGLTGASSQGYSGEGTLLHALAEENTLDDAQQLLEHLSFQSLISQGDLDIGQSRMERALPLLAGMGVLGYDVGEGAYFHRELPHDPDRVEKGNPRLIAAQKLLAADAVEHLAEGKWLVHSGEQAYPVYLPEGAPIDRATCTCHWYLRNQNSRGPCKHILAVQLRRG